MPRTDNDAWDSATGVGATATMVAAARAIATKADNPLIDDPFTEAPVRDHDARACRLTWPAGMTVVEKGLGAAPTAARRPPRIRTRWDGARAVHR